MQCRLSESNYLAVHGVLTRLDRGELTRLEGLARQESILTEKRIADADEAAKQPVETIAAAAPAGDGTVARPKAAKLVAATGAEKPQRKRGNSGTIILTALNAHHKYDGTSIGEWTPIGVRELSELTRPKQGEPISPATVTRWFNGKFSGGYSGYERECTNTSNLLLTSLKQLNGDFTPRARDIAVGEQADRQADRTGDTEFDES